MRRVASAASVPSVLEEDLREKRRSRVSEEEKKGSMRPTTLRELEDRKAEKLRTGLVLSSKPIVHAATKTKGMSAICRARDHWNGSLAPPSEACRSTC